MGVVIGYISKSKPLKAVFNGQTVLVHREKMLCNARDLETRFFETKEMRLRRMAMQNTIDRVHDAWGTERPQYYTYMPENNDPTGMEVYTDVKTVTPDDHTSNGRIVGYMVRQGRGWAISTEKPAK